MRKRGLPVAIALVATFAVVACTSGTGEPPALDAGVQQATAGSCVNVGAARASDGFSLRAAPCVDQRSLGPGQLLLTASGEVLAIAGFDFPVDPNGTFADGWQIRFSHVMTTIDRVSLWDNPDMIPTDQSQHGPLLAELDGPWAVDLHQNGLRWPYVAGKEQGETAIAFAVLGNESANGGAAFPTDGTRLAVGFSLVVPTAKALNVNLDADGLAAYEQMVAEGCTVYYRGTATWMGTQGVCKTPGDAAASTDGLGEDDEFSLVPPVVDFDFCFRPADSGGLKPGDPETSYVNCDNQDNDPSGPALNGEPHLRGIAFKSNTYAVGEITVHTDHPFWESTKHDTPPRFDQFAARTVGASASDGGVPVVHFEDVRGVDYTGFTDARGNALPWRTCDPNYQDPNGGSRIGQMHFDPIAVPHCVNGNDATGLCDYYDFSKYNQSTQGHWNGADGLCFVQRHYPSPP